jgi:hypothetical protein
MRGKSKGAWVIADGHDWVWTGWGWGISTGPETEHAIVFRRRSDAEMMLGLLKQRRDVYGWKSWFVREPKS